MSGPKHGYYINYKSEIDKVLEIIKNEQRTIEKIIKEAYNLSQIDERTKALIKSFTSENVDLRIENFRKFLKETENNLKSLINKINIKNYDRKTLDDLRKITNTLKIYKENLISQKNQFSSSISKIISKSQKEANDYKEKLINEIRQIINKDEITFIEEWSKSQRISELSERMKNLERKDIFQINDEIKEIMELYNNLKSEALNNKKNYEIKVETSKKIMETLIEMNFTNIERKLESDKFGNIIVNAETPNGDWNLSFQIGNDNQIKVITPYDERCYTSLNDIILKLKDIGIEMDLEELRKRRENQKQKQDIKERERGQ